MQMALYVPLAIFFLKLISRADNTVSISYVTVATSVGVFLRIPLGAAILTRLVIRTTNPRLYDRVFLKCIAP